MQERLEPVFPYMNQEQVQQVALLIGPGGQRLREARVPRAGGSPMTLGGLSSFLRIAPLSRLVLNTASSRKFTRSEAVLRSLAQGAGVSPG